MELGERIHTQTWDEAVQEVHRRKREPDGAAFIYKIVESAYEGFDVVVLDPDSYVETLVDQVSIHPQIGKTRMGGYAR